jgi:hypothetical protein
MLIDYFLLWNDVRAETCAASIARLARVFSLIVHQDNALAFILAQWASVEVKITMTVNIRH